MHIESTGSGVSIDFFGELQFADVLAQPVLEQRRLGVVARSRR